MNFDKKLLELLAIKIELDAEASLLSWELFGQSNRYTEDLSLAAKLRQASKIKRVAERRDFLNEFLNGNIL